MESVERTKNETRRDLDATRGGDVNAGVGASGVGSLGGGVRSGTRSIHGIGGAVGGAVGGDVGGDRVGGGDAGAGVGVDFVGGGHVVGDTYDSIVICRDLEKRFPGAEALRGVSFDLPHGAIVGLLGPNGSGKSTLLKLMAGLYRPTSGTVLVAGRRPDRRTKALIAYLPEVDHLYPWMTVRESIDFVRSFFDDWDDERGQALADFMGLEPTKKVGTMSKGMRARLRLVLTLARSAPLVLLDEPLSGIDPPSRSRIVEAILSEYRAGQQTFVISTHEVLEMEPLFDRLLLLENGVIKLHGDAEQLRAEFGRSVQGIMEEVFG